MWLTPYSWCLGSPEQEAQAWQAFRRLLSEKPDSCKIELQGERSPTCSQNLAGDHRHWSRGRPGSALCFLVSVLSSLNTEHKQGPVIINSEPSKTPRYW